jgi:acetoacetyl-CoA reductase
VNGVADLNGKSALVTGAASGIGRAVATDLAVHGARVLLADLNVGDGEAAAKAIPGSIFQRADVSSRADCRALVDRAAAEWGGVDVLVNNAGLQHVSPIEEFPEDRWEQLVRIMLFGAFYLTRYAIPHMYERGWGRIVNISSVNGQRGQFGQTNYSTAKAGIHGFTMALAQEVAARGVTVNTVSPGYIGTDMVRAIKPDRLEKIVSGIPVKRLGEPAEIASIVAWLVSDEAAFATGADFSLNGGLHMG